jgi:hypothetical protein
MKRALAALALTAVTAQASAGAGEVAAGVILGAIIAQPRTVYVQPYQPAYPVYIYPQQIYTPHPVYGQPQMHGYPRVITSSEPCHYIGQMVMTFDQYNRPIGYRNCQ